MIISTVKSIFYLSALLLAFSCIATANNMSIQTRKLMVAFMELIVVGATGMVIAVFYETQVSWTILAILPIMWGISGWLLFDTYQPHDWILYISNFIQEKRNGKVKRQRQETGNSKAIQ